MTEERLRDYLKRATADLHRTRQLADLENRDGVISSLAPDRLGTARNDDQAGGGLESATTDERFVLIDREFGEAP